LPGGYKGSHERRDTPNLRIATIVGRQSAAEQKAVSQKGAADHAGHLYLQTRAVEGRNLLSLTVKAQFDIKAFDHVIRRFQRIFGLT